MNHKPYLDWMHIALDGDLPPVNRRQLTEHFTRCPECQSRWDALTEAQRQLKAEPLAAPRTGFTGRFQARLAEQRARPRALWGALVLGFGAVGAAALVLPLGLSALLSVTRLAQQPATNAALYSGLSAAGNMGHIVFGAIATTICVLATLVLEQPLTWLAGLTALAVVGAWIYFFRKWTPEVAFR